VSPHQTVARMVNPVVELERYSSSRKLNLSESPDTSPRCRLRDTGRTRSSTLDGSDASPREARMNASEISDTSVRHRDELSEAPPGPRRRDPIDQLRQQSAARHHQA
jgi:hypothetical protein